MSAYESDVCVVGAGIVGLAHALEARARGLTVTVVERDDRAVGASVRNFGHVIVSGMAAGEPLQVALRARQRWLALGRETQLQVLEAGSLIVARERDELALLEAIAADPTRGARMVDPDGAVELAPVARDGLLGALYCELDLRVDPRRAAAALASLLDADDDARVLFGTAVHEVFEGGVRSAAGTILAPLVIVCPGADHAWLAAELSPRRIGLTRCKLQMLRVRAPSGRPCRPALLTGLSLLRYPGFSDRPGADRLAARFGAERPELVRAGIHLIVTELPGGDLLLGDTHDYGDTVSPFRDERLDELVLNEACRLLGAERLQVVERWQGVYPQAPGDPFLVQTPLPGVAVVEIVAGIGMTTALGVPPLTFGRLGEPAAAAA